MDEIHQKNEEIFNQNNEILQLLRSRFSTEQLANKLYQHLEGFPLSTVEQFSNLEKQANKHERQKVVSGFYLFFLKRNFNFLIINSFIC